MSKWIGGLAEWVDGDTAYLSIAFTWKIEEAIEKALMHSFLGRKVQFGGPALFQTKMRTLIEPYGEYGSEFLKDVARWANGFVWRNTPFDEYDHSFKKKREPVYDEQQGLFC